MGALVEWFTDPALYLNKTYDEKVALLGTLYKPITGEMIAAELEQYFNSEQRYADDQPDRLTARHADQTRERGGDSQPSLLGQRAPNHPADLQPTP